MRTEEFFRGGIWAHFLRPCRKKPGYPLQFLDFGSRSLRDFRFYPLRGQRAHSDFACPGKRTRKRVHDNKTLRAGCRGGQNRDQLGARVNVFQLKERVDAGNFEAKTRSPGVLRKIGWYNCV
jgi:hypothetical protein